MNIQFTLYFTVVITLLSAAAYGSESSLYDFMWLDQDKKVYVLQNKTFKKEKTFYTNVGVGKTINSDFQKVQTLMINSGYNFHEEWGVEALYLNYENKSNSAFDNLQKVNTTYPFIRKLNQSYGVLATWTPFYGKINTFNKIIHFDWKFGAGVTRIEGENNRETFINRSSYNYYQKERHTAAALKAGVSVKLTKKVHLSLEMLNQYYKASDPVNPAKKDLNTNTDALLSIGFSF